MDKDKKDKPTIGMLLDVEHVYGESESRLGPWIISLLISGVPIIVYVYFALFTYIPVWLFSIVEIIVIARVLMIVQGRENYRMKIFKRTLYDEYTSTAKLMNIKTIHKDGCIEYTNGTIMYLVASFNGTCENEVRRSIDVRKFLKSLLGDYIFDIYIHNITLSEELRNYYEYAALFNKNESAKNFIKIIDYTLSLTEDTSMVQCTIFAIKGKRSDWKDIRNQINIAINSKVAECYKTVYLVSDFLEVNDIINRDIDTTISFSELLRSKYKTGDYDSSKVLAYDLPDDKIIIQGKEAVESIIPEQTNHSFHVMFKED